MENDVSNKTDTNNKTLKKDSIFSKMRFNISGLNILLFLFVVFYITTIFISFEIIKMRRFDFLSKKPSVKLQKERIAVIPIYGVIYKKEYYFSEKGSDLIVSMIKKYGEDKSIKAIVLDINSPGGSVGAVEEIYSQIKRIRKKYKKPFVAHLGDIAASGAYYIASACDKIWEI